MYNGKLFTYFSPDERSDDVRKWFADGQFNQVDHVSDAELIVVSGGDGTLLNAIHMFGAYGKPFFGIHRGTLGFMMSRVGSADQLEEILSRGGLRSVSLKLLKAVFTDGMGARKEFHAFNDIYVNAVYGTQVRGYIVGEDHPKREFFGDGIVVATAQGSTSYNRNAGGAVLPLPSPMLAIRTICQSVSLRSVRDVVDPQRLEIEIVKGEAVGHADTRNNRIDDVKHIVIQPSDLMVTLQFDPKFKFNEVRYL